MLRAAHALTTDQRDRISNIAITAAHAAPDQQNPGINFQFYIPPTARVPLHLEWLLVGVALVANDDGPLWARALGFVALTFASVNIFGGFLVTQRMLAMYQKKKK